MAEKEERIRVLIAKNPCKECSLKKCTRKCTFGLLFEKAPGITRQEAIEHMAKARYAQRPCYDKKGNEISFEDAKENYQLFYEDLIKEVEPLLNALLEGK